MEMTLKDAVRFCMTNAAAINTPTQEIYDKLVECAKELGIIDPTINLYERYEKDTCISVRRGELMFCDIEEYKDMGFKIIWLVDDLLLYSVR